MPPDNLIRAGNRARLPIYYHVLRLRYPPELSFSGFGRAGLHAAGRDFPVFLRDSMYFIASRFGASFLLKTLVVPFSSFPISSTVAPNCKPEKRIIKGFLRIIAHSLTAFCPVNASYLAMMASQ